ncbi:MAG: chemoreceptor glutamine deamidase CheD, partial [Planctomycetes bacterium]|nr:chemoreceptor glutamine deamidase CheD [Planctomycetota bacterium]
DIGRSNSEFVTRYLEEEGIPVAAEDVGGHSPRRLLYFPREGRALVRKVKRQDREIVEKERRYLRGLSTEPIAGEVELFDG